MVVGGGGSVCLRKIILPQLRSAVGLGTVSAGFRRTGSNRAALAWSRADRSASLEPQPEANVGDIVLPSASTAIRTTLLLRISGFSHERNGSDRSEKRR